MATYYARKAGNINAADVWATTPSGIAAAVTFADGDVLMANSFAITVNVSVNLGATGQVRTDTTGGATAGGTFFLNNGVTLTANLFGGIVTAPISQLNSGSATITGNCTGGGWTTVAAFNNSTGTLTINGNVTGGTGDTADGCRNETSGTITINGNVTGGSNNGSGAYNKAGGIINITGNVLGAGFGGRGVFNNSSGRINISGNVTGGSNASNAHGAVNLSTGRIVITNGTVTGGSNAAAYGVHNASTGVIEITGVVNGASSGAPGVRNESTGSVLLTGTATGGSNSAGYGVHNFGNGVVTITGLAAGGSAATGARNEAAGIINLTRAVGNGFGFGSVGLSAATGVTNVSVTGEIVLKEIEYGVLGMTPTSGSRIKLLPQGTNQAKFNFTSTGTTKTLVDATQGDMPAVSNVRSGTTYAMGTLTGTLAVPPAASVSLGVPVDNTTGTAMLTPAAVWSHATRTITGGLVDTATTLTNAPTVPTTSQIASQVRTELSSELAKVSALNPTRLGQCTTTEILGNLLAQANS